MNTDEQVIDDDFLFYSVIYSTITVVFAMAVLSKFLTNEFRFGFRSFLSLVILFIGEPLCHFLLKGPHGVAIFGLGCFLVYSVLPASHLPAQDKAVLITGCDSGFGHALVKKLDSIGMQVFAGCLHECGPGAIELKNSCSERLRILKLDVTSNEDISAAFEYISSLVGEKGLWGVVNNAGIWCLGELEMVPEKHIRRVIDVNLMGTITISKTFLPLVRLSQGRIVNMSSLTGRVPMHSFGVYSLSKHGIEAFSDVLRMEVKKWGIMVSTIQPTGFCTASMNEQTTRSNKEELWKNMDPDIQYVYGRDYFDRLFSNFSNNRVKLPTDLTPVIRAMRSGLLSKRPRTHYPCGLGAETLLSVIPVLPVWIAEKIISAIGLQVKDLNPAALHQNET